MSYVSYVQSTALQCIAHHQHGKNRARQGKTPGIATTANYLDPKSTTREECQNILSTVVRGKTSLLKYLFHYKIKYSKQTSTMLFTNKLYKNIKITWNRGLKTTSY